jgi:hypothetical protein
MKGYWESKHILKFKIIDTFYQTFKFHVALLLFSNRSILGIRYFIKFPVVDPDPDPKIDFELWIVRKVRSFVDPISGPLY